MELSDKLELLEAEVNKRKMEGEVRRIHIIYFLSRKGHIEHPHLVRVHHYSQNGVHLCDVKRWLAELRGKDMPESFAWSYKRRYRTGYVWQDLVDEDLITPISDNEYVLKGSEIPSNYNTNATDVNGEEKVSVENECTEHDEITVDQNISSPEDTQQHQETTIYNVSPKTYPISSPECFTLTANSINHEEEKLLDTNKEDVMKDSNIDKSDNSHESFNSTKSNQGGEHKKKENTKRKKKKDTSADSSRMASPKPNTSFNMVKKIFNCRAVETKDSVMVKLNKRICDKEVCTIKNSIEKDENSNVCNNTSEIFKEGNLEGSEKALLKSWRQQKFPSARASKDEVTRSNSTRSQSKSPKPHKPINGPNCSQCGKMFRPEKMHKHMRSCSARRSFGKPSGAFAAKSTTNVHHDMLSKSMGHSTSQELVSGYYLNYYDKE